MSPCEHPIESEERALQFHPCRLQERAYATEQSKRPESHSGVHNTRYGKQSAPRNCAALMQIRPLSVMCPAGAVLSETVESLCVRMALISIPARR